MTWEREKGYFFSLAWGWTAGDDDHVRLGTGGFETTVVYTTMYKIVPSMWTELRASAIQFIRKTGFADQSSKR